METCKQELKAARKEAKKYREALEQLTGSVEFFLEALDKVMKEPSTFTRGRKIAKLCDLVQWENQRVLFLILGKNVHKYEGVKLDKAPTLQTLDHMMVLQGRPT